MVCYGLCNTYNSSYTTIKLVVPSGKETFVAMKPFRAIPLLLCVAYAVIIPRKADYNGYKVVRLEVGEHLPKVQSLIKKLSLSTWNGGPKEHSTVDVVVPAGVTTEFEGQVADLSPHVMHANLGASIARETTYPIYRRRSIFSMAFTL